MVDRIRPILVAAAVCLSLSAPVDATTGGEPAPARAFTVICEVAETCHVGGGCASLPALGQIIVQFDGIQTAMGQAEASLSPIDRFARIEDVHPLPRISDARREVLVDLPATDGTDRRFALFVQPITAPEAAPILQSTYFILSCRTAEG